MHARDEYVPGKVHISSEVLMKYYIYTPNFGAIEALKYFLFQVLSMLYILQYSF